MSTHVRIRIAGENHTIIAEDNGKIVATTCRWKSWRGKPLDEFVKHLESWQLFDPNLKFVVESI